MFMNDKVSKVLSDQYNKELYAAYLYKAMQIWAVDEGWDGLSAWMKNQVEEELEHAEKIADYIQYRGGKVELKAVERPEGSWNTTLDIMKAALEHEQFVTDSIYACVDAAKEEKDYATVSFLKWYVDEQAEEEDSVVNWVDKLEMAGDNLAALMAIDGMMGRRDD